jgi:two-component system nitrogen regulation response regulator NtrX
VTRILIVDDEEGIRSSLVGILGDEGFVAAAVSDGEAALAELSVHPETDLVLLDIAMPGRDGIAILAEMRERWPAVSVVMMSGHGTVESAVRSTRLGAFDFIEKPLSIDQLLLTIEHAVERAQLERENARLRAARVGAVEIFGESDAILELKRQIERAAPTSGWALITGENGTGKELVARQLHLKSQRSRGPFVAVNCAAIPEELIESELFGHEKGAFTGATDFRVGRFEAAHGGTLLLDEIGELELSLQVKLLRALQEKKIERIGNPHSIEVDTRIIAATNRNLAREIETGRFRNDLYYRVNVISIEIPPLRDRREDIRLLAEAFLERIRDEIDRDLEFDSEALAAIERYAWPGNVRELENAIESGAALCDGNRIGLEDLPHSILSAGRSDRLREAWRSGQGGFEETVGRFERELILEALERHRWNQTRAADDLGITRRVLKIKMDRFDIPSPERATAE